MKWSIPTHIIEAGHELVMQHRVLSIVPHCDQKQWQASVMTDQRYEVILDGTAKEDDRCTCAYFKRHHYCEHTVACELYLKEQGFSRIIQPDVDYRPLLQQEQDEQLLLQPLFQWAQTQPQKRVPLALTVLLHIADEQGYASLKIGKREGRSYVVKDLAVFATAYFTNDSYELGKKDAVMLSKDAFSTEDQHLLELLHVALEEASAYQHLAYNRRSFVLPAATFMALLQQLNREQRLILNDQPCHYAQQAGKLPITLKMSNINQQLQLKQIASPAIMLGSQEWFLSKEGWWPLTPFQVKGIAALNDLFKTDSTFVLSEEMIQPFMNTVYPQLQMMIHIEESESLATKWQRYPLEIMGMVQKTNTGLILTPQYHYGPYNVTTDANSAFVMRQLDKEQAFESLLEKQGYQQQHHQFVKKVPTTADWYHFFNVEWPQLQQYAHLVLDDALKHKYRMTPLQSEIHIDEESRWLSVRFDISGISSEDLQPLIQSIQKHDAFYETMSGEIINLQDATFDKTHEVLDHIREHIQSDGKVHLPKYKALQLADLPLQQSQDFQQLLQDLKDSDHFNVSLPKGLQTTLRPYQYKGYQWLKMLSHYGLSGILADDMGLGKTIQVLTYLLSEYEVQSDFHALIVVPASVLYNWQAEAMKWTPTLEVGVIHGDKAQRQEQIKAHPTLSIVSYASFRQDTEWFETMDYQCLILDEAQMVKNSQSKTFKALQRLDIPQRFAVSGTPVENKKEELWALFQLIMPGFLPKKTTFKQLELPFIAKMIQPFVLRRTKEEVLSDLPLREDILYYSRLTDEQKKLYLAYLEQMQQKLKTMDDQTLRKNRLPILAGLTRLRQICCTPSLFDEKYHGTSGKIEQLKTLLLQAHDNHRRILLFSQFKTMLHQLEPVLDELGLTYFMLTGETKAEERLAQVDAFNQGERDVFLISLKAGGVGLNLTGADTVILFDSWWNPAIEEQAAGRAHRIGQKKSVEVWHLIAEGTIEERIYELQQQKRDLFQNMMEAKEEDKLHQLTDDDLRYLLQFGRDNESV